MGHYKRLFPRFNSLPHKYHPPRINLTCKKNQKGYISELETVHTASAVNRTRGPSMATMDFTTKPLMPSCCRPIAYSTYGGWPRALGPLSLLLRCAIFATCKSGSPWALVYALRWAVQDRICPSSA